MGSKKKIPDDMELFRRKMGDVRPLKFDKRVPTNAPRAEGKPEPTISKPSDSVKDDSSSKFRCPVSPNKNMYATMEEATNAAQYVKQSLRKSVRPYQCDFCSKYHLTSKVAR